MAPNVFTATCLWVGASQLKTATLSLQIASHEILLEQPSLKSNTLSAPLGISYSAILLLLRPASLIPKNAETCKKIHNMHPIGRKID